MRTEKEIREKLKLLMDKLVDNLSDFKKHDISLAKLRISINSIRYCLGEVDFVFPQIKNHYRRNGKKDINNREKRV